MRWRRLCCVLVLVILAAFTLFGDPAHHRHIKNHAYAAHAHVKKHAQRGAVHLLSHVHGSGHAAAETVKASTTHAQKIKEVEAFLREEHEKSRGYDAQKNLMHSKHLSPEQLKGLIDLTPGGGQAVLKTAHKSKSEELSAKRGAGGKRASPGGVLLGGHPMEVVRKHSRFAEQIHKRHHTGNEA